MTRLLLAAAMLPFNPPFVSVLAFAAVGGLIAAWAVLELHERRTG